MTKSLGADVPKLTEAARLSYGVSTRLQRKTPDQALQFHGHTIPPGVNNQFFFLPRTRRIKSYQPLITDSRWYDVRVNAP